MGYIKNQVEDNGFNPINVFATQRLAKSYRVGINQAGEHTVLLIPLLTQSAAKKKRTTTKRKPKPKRKDVTMKGFINLVDALIRGSVIGLFVVAFIWWIFYSK